VSSTPEPRQAARPRKKEVVVVKDGHLPVNELLFNRSGAPSPFGEELQFPLPPDQLRYSHTGEEPV